MDAILAYLQSERAHRSASEVYEAVRKVIPNISLGTVYRNLGQLVELGRLSPLKLKTNSSTMTDSLTLTLCVEDVKTFSTLKPKNFIQRKLQVAVLKLKTKEQSTMDCAMLVNQAKN